MNFMCRGVNSYMQEGEVSFSEGVNLIVQWGEFIFPGWWNLMFRGVSLYIQEGELLEWRKSVEKPLGESSSKKPKNPKKVCNYGEIQTRTCCKSSASTTLKDWLNWENILQGGSYFWTQTVLYTTKTTTTNKQTKQNQKYGAKKNYFLQELRTTINKKGAFIGDL